MKLSRPVLYMLIATLIAAVFLWPGDEAASGSSSSRPKTKKAASKSDVRWTSEDLHVNKEGKGFAPVNEPLRNAFKPLVARSDRSGVAAGWTGVPVDIAGEASWVYTGMAEIDGVPMALLENTRTADGVFLKQGETWKGATVHQITPNELVLTISGEQRRVKVNETPQALAQQSVGGFAPVNPPLRGPIGNNNIEVRPERENRRTARRSGGEVAAPEMGMGVNDDED